MTSTRQCISSRKRQRGATAVEFGFCAIFFFTFIFGMIELSRALYLWNTMTEVTRRAARAAAHADFSSAATMTAVRQRAMFDSITLPMAGQITSNYLTIDYLQADRQSAVNPMPGSPTENLVNCTANPNAANCIRFVRVRLCQGGGSACSRVPYESLGGIEIFSPSTFKFPTFATITPAGSLGRMP